MPKEPAPTEFQGFQAVTSARMRELDQMATERFGISVPTLMENAGRGVAEETAQYLEQKLSKSAGKSSIVDCCGRNELRRRVLPGSSS